MPSHNTQSTTTKRFRTALRALPKTVRVRAKSAYQLWRDDPAHKSLRFKKVHTRKPIYSVRIDMNYRALAVQDAGAYVWFWIGSHDDYEKLLKNL